VFREQSFCGANDKLKFIGQVARTRVSGLQTPDLFRGSIRSYYLYPGCSEEAVAVVVFLPRIEPLEASLSGAVSGLPYLERVSS
jgi:hypothetical protein